MATRSQAEIYLEALQERANAALGIVVDQEKRRERYKQAIETESLRIIGAYAPTLSDEEQRQLRANTLAYLSKRLELELPTRLEDPFAYSLMLHLLDEIEDAARSLSKHVRRPIVGTIPTRHVNALAVLVPDCPDYLVIFDPEVFMFALLMSKCVVKALPFRGATSDSMTLSTTDRDVQQQVDGDPEVVERFRDVLLAYLLTGEPGNAQPYLPEEPYGTLAGRLRQSMEIFIMGHEYAHIACGHLSRVKVMGATLAGQSVEEIEWSWDQEYEADALGLRLMLHALDKRGYDLAQSYWGADMFFSCLDVVEQAVSILRKGYIVRTASPTHPPTSDRRHALRTLMRDLHRGDLAAIALAETLERTVMLLWERTKPRLLLLHQAGQKLAPSWS
jgi:hypothetical protein